MLFPPYDNFAEYIKDKDGTPGLYKRDTKEDIEYNKNLLIKKYKSMYKNHNNYHPSNLHFLSRPPSLKFSSGTQYYYELVHQNIYLGNKIKQIQNSVGNYNSNKTISDYKKSKELGDKIAERSKYKNMLLNLISPFTYEKRLNKLLENKRKEKKRMTITAKPKFYNTARGFYRTKKIPNNNIEETKEKELNKNIENEKKIIIERENMTTTKEETVWILNFCLFFKLMISLIIINFRILINKII